MMMTLMTRVTDCRKFLGCSVRDVYHERRSLADVVVRRPKAALIVGFLSGKVVKMAHLKNRGWISEISD